MHADVEIPATLAATYLLDIPDHYTSHSFTYIFTKYFINAFKFSVVSRELVGGSLSAEREDREKQTGVGFFFFF